MITKRSLKIYAIYIQNKLPWIMRSRKPVRSGAPVKRTCLKPPTADWKFPLLWSGVLRKRRRGGVRLRGTRGVLYCHCNRSTTWQQRIYTTQRAQNWNARGPLRENLSCLRIIGDDNLCDFVEYYFLRRLYIDCKINYYYKLLTHTQEWKHTLFWFTINRAIASCSRFHGRPRKKQAFVKTYISYNYITHVSHARTQTHTQKCKHA